MNHGQEIIVHYAEISEVVLSVSLSPKISRIPAIKDA
jgi:hypothetical protein